MDVTFATAGGREFTVEVWYFATVRRIKETVRAREGIPVAAQRLFLPGREGPDGDELDDARDTEHYGILQGSRLVLVLVPDDDPRPPPAPSPSPAPSAAAEDDGAPPSDPPAAMDVSAVVRPSPPPQNPTAAAPFVVGNGGGGAAAARANQQQRIEVRVVVGETAVTMEVGAMDVVRDLRKEVERLRLPIPVRDGGAGGYFFVYKQNAMDEDRTLRWHEVNNGDTIEIFNGTVTGGGGGA